MVLRMLPDFLTIVERDEKIDPGLIEKELPDELPAAPATAGLFLRTQRRHTPVERLWYE